MDKSQRNYRLFIEEGFRTFQEVEAGVPMASVIEITPPFTLEFQVTRNTLSSANTSSFTIYNLGENTRKRIYKDAFDLDVYKGIELRAGYGNIMPTIFKGNINRAYSVKMGGTTNYLTKIDAYDGGFAFVNGQANLQLGAQTPNNAVLDAIIKTLPAVNKGAIGDFPGVIARGNSITGSSQDLLDSLSNGGFFVDLEKAYCLKNDECIQGSLDVITSAAGLLGSPQREKTILTFDMIFEPRMLIGQLIQLSSLTEKNFNGNYKVISLHHNGMISDSVCGSAVTSVGLWYGTELLRVIN